MSSSSSSLANSGSDADSSTITGLQVETEPTPPSLVHSINIQTHVPVVLDFNETSYTAWVRAFSAIFGQYGLSDHVDGSPAHSDSDWVQIDCAIVSWFYNRIAADVLSSISHDRDTTYSLWRAVRALFRDNRETRAIYLSAEFRAFMQGDLSVLAYCTRLKNMVDRLGDLGAPVTEKDLVRNIVRGLNPQLHSVVPHITLRKRLQSFLRARSILLLEEQHQAESAKITLDDQ